MSWTIFESQPKGLMAWGCALVVFSQMIQPVTPLERLNCSKAYGIARNTDEYNLAVKKCASFGMTVTSPETEKEIATVNKYFLSQMIAKHEIAYLGPRDYNDSNYYRLQDGRPLNSVDGLTFDRSYPRRSNNYRCLAITFEGLWYDYPCYFKKNEKRPRSAICELCIAHRPDSPKTETFCVCSNGKMNSTQNSCHKSCLKIKRFDHLKGTIPCKPQRYGPDCIFQCHCKDDTPCDINTGACPDGCQNNWYGLACNLTKCPLNRWGRDCDKLCFCENEQHCHSITGYCMVGCMPGLQDKHCLLSVCENGKYGPRCNRSCHCKETVPCSKNGICVSDAGCSDVSWVAPRCVTTKCPTGSYGSKCQYYCNCVDNEQCDSSGMCSSGCALRWTGRSCNQTWCPVGYYGEACNTACECDPGLPCSRVAGVCLGANVVPDKVCEEPQKTGHDCNSSCEDPNCRTCERHDPESCRHCNVGYIVTPGMTCDLENTYCDKARTTGITCDNNCVDKHCLRCERHNDSICVYCQPGRFLTSDKTCIDHPEVCELPGQAGHNCEEKCQDKACLQCRKHNKDVCHSCMFGFMLTSDMKCDEDTYACGAARKWGPHCQRLCSDRNCLRCRRTDGDICIKCKPGYNINFFYMCSQPKVYHTEQPRKSWTVFFLGLLVPILIPVLFYASIRDIYRGLEPPDSLNTDEEQTAERSAGFSLSNETYISTTEV